MTTLRTIVTDALRESGLIQVGTDPEAAEFLEGLSRLQRIIKSLIGQELGENLQDITFGTSGLQPSHTYEDFTNEIKQRYVPSNVRLLFNNAQAETVYLDPSPRDGARVAVIDSVGNFATYNITLNANGRKIESASSVVLDTNSLAREWFYRADLGYWTRVTDLEAGDESPFPQEFDDLLITMLAMRLNHRYGETTAPETIETLKRSRGQFRSRYRQLNEVEVEEALARMHPHRHHSRGLGNLNDRFNIGRP